MDRSDAVTRFAANYVDEVEADEPDEDDDRRYGFDLAMEIAWRRHAELIRLREASGQEFAGGHGRPLGVGILSG